MVLSEMPKNVYFDDNGCPGPRKSGSDRAARAEMPRGERLAVRERIAVWNSLSRLWLAQMLTEDDRLHIAHTLAASPFDLPELERICVYEVAPVVHGNLRQEQGVWGNFDAAWLLSSIEQNMRRIRYREEALRKREHMMELVGRDWDTVKAYVKALRSAPGLSVDEQQGLLRLMQEGDGK